MRIRIHAHKGRHAPPLFECLEFRYMSLPSRIHRALLLMSFREAAANSFGAELLHALVSLPLVLVAPTGDAFVLDLDGEFFIGCTQA